MIGKTLTMGLAAALALGVALPANAQMTPQTNPGQMGTSPDTSMPPSNMGNSMNSTTPSQMSKSEMATMQKCQAMTADAMAKSRRCTRLMQKYPQGSATPM